MMRSDVAVTTKGSMEVSRQVHVVSLDGRSESVENPPDCTVHKPLTKGYHMSSFSHSLTSNSDRTLRELTRILSDNNIEYFIKEKNGCVVRMHFLVREEEK